MCYCARGWTLLTQRRILCETAANKVKTVTQTRKVFVIPHSQQTNKRRQKKAKETGDRAGNKKDGEKVARSTLEERQRGGENLFGLLCIVAI